MYFCGIDVAKYEHAALVVDDKGQTIQPAFSFDNSRAGVCANLKGTHPAEL
jgi:transposase